MKYSLRAIIERCLSLDDDELSSEELENCLQSIANSFLPLKYILQTIAQDSLTLHKDWPRGELRNHLQKIANAFLSLFDNMSPVLILIEEDKLWVSIKGEDHEACACYYPEKEGDQQKKEKNEGLRDFIKVSGKYLDSCRNLPGKWVGLLLHELIHAYVARAFRSCPNYQGRISWANGHNVWFFKVALSIQVQLELVLFEWDWLQIEYGDIDLHLQGTLDCYAVLERRYYPHLEKARHKFMQRIEEARSFLLTAKEDTESLQEDSDPQFILITDEDYEDECSGVYGDVIYRPQLFGR